MERVFTVKQNNIASMTHIYGKNRQARNYKSLMYVHYFSIQSLFYMHKFSYLIPVISALCEIVCTLPMFSGMCDMPLHKSSNYSKNYTNTLKSLNKASVVRKKFTSIQEFQQKLLDIHTFSM